MKSKIPFDIKYRPQIESGEYKVIDQFGYVLTLKDIINDVWYFSLRYPNTDYETERIYDHPENHLFIVMPEEELTEFEQEVSDMVEYCKEHGEHVAFDYAKRHAKTLLSDAREQFIKDGYVIEKKAFHDAVKKVDPEVMKEVSDSVNKENELAKKHLEGYIKGREDTLRKMRAFIESHFNAQSGTSAATLYGNTSATDGKEHNPSFTD